MQDNDGGGVCQIEIKGADHQIFSIFAKGSVFNLASQYSPSSFAVFKKRRNSSENCRKAAPFCFNVVPVYQLESCLLASSLVAGWDLQEHHREHGGEPPLNGGGVSGCQQLHLHPLYSYSYSPSLHRLVPAGENHNAFICSYGGGPASSISNFTLSTVPGSFEVSSNSRRNDCQDCPKHGKMAAGRGFLLRKATSYT